MKSLSALVVGFALGLMAAPCVEIVVHLPEWLIPKTAKGVNRDQIRPRRLRLPAPVQP